MSSVRLALHQFRFDQKTFWRNPASVGFTVLFPVMFLVLFELLFGSSTLQGLDVDSSTYYVPAIITLAVVSATFQNLAMSVTIDRENGLLKRTRGTPLPSWAFIAGRVGNSVMVAVIMLALVAALGRIAYGVAIPWERLPAVLDHPRDRRGDVLVPRPGADGGDPLAGGGGADHEPRHLPALLPLRRARARERDPGRRHPVLRDLSRAALLRGLLHRLEPTTTGAGFEWADLAVVAAWGVAGLLIALLTFRWEPRA